VIRCRLGIDRGMLSAFSSTGHGRVDHAEARVSISCAAVSTLVRSIGMLLEKSELVIVGLDRFAPGDVKLRVEHVDESAEDWLRGLTDMLAQGLEDAARDFPDQIEFLLADEKIEGR
jgi:uncharacterized protein YsxB (DUF464 family)